MGSWGFRRMSGLILGGDSRNVCFFFFSGFRSRDRDKVFCDRSYF